MGAPKLTNVAAVTVSNAAVIVAPANPKRLGLIITQTTANPVRLGTSAVAATTGARLGQNEKLPLGCFLGGDHRGQCPTEDIYGIREGGVDGSCCVLEYTDT